MHNRAGRIPGRNWPRLSVCLGGGHSGTPSLGSQAAAGGQHQHGLAPKGPLQGIQRGGVVIGAVLVFAVQSVGIGVIKYGPFCGAMAARIWLMSRFVKSPLPR